MSKVGIVLASLAMSVMLVGCATKEDQGTLLGAAAGGLIGNQFGHGGGKVAATMAGVVVGGLVGNRIGRQMDEDDRRRAMEAEYAAMDSGERREWRNPSNGRYGYVAPRRIYTYRSMRCREYEATVYIDGRPETMVGKACQQPDGSWREV
jgi:surface antigen